MAVSASYKAFVLEQLAGAGTLTARAMFGGVGLYCQGLFFALIDDDTLYLKVDDATRPDFERLGSDRSAPTATNPRGWGTTSCPPRCSRIARRRDRGSSARSRWPAGRPEIPQTALALRDRSSPSETACLDDSISCIQRTRSWPDLAN